MITSLFHPFNSGNREFKNRAIAAPPPSMLASESGLVTSDLLDYYQKLAETGVSTVIVESTNISADAKAWQQQLDISVSESLNGLSRLVEKIRQRGALPMIQFFHGGFNAFPNASRCVYGPSEIQLKGLKFKILSLSPAMITQIIQDYIAAAVMAWNAGFSGIEIQAAEGSLAQQFLSPLTNKRQDAYGRHNLDGALFLKEVVTGIKRATPDLTLSCKLSGKDLIPGGLGLNATLAIASMLKKEGVSIFHLTEGLVIGNPLRQHSSLDKNAPEAPFAEDSQILRNEINHPVILSGKISSTRTAELRLRNGFCDMVSIGRTLNRNLSWLKLAHEADNQVQQNSCLRCEICFAASRGCPDRQ